MFYSPTFGRYIHNPMAVAQRMATGSGLASTIAEGNYKTRMYRQKPVVVLETHTHKPREGRRGPSQGTVVAPQKKVERKVLRLRGGGPEAGIPSRAGIRSGVNSFLGSSNPMAFSRRKSSFKRKSRPRRRRNFKRRLPPLVLPRTRVVRFRQVFNWGLGAATGAIATTMFKANSLNDPGGSATAILPLGLDQWAAQYKKYIVLGSKCIVRGAWTSTGNTGPAVLGLHLDDNNTALTSAAHYKMLPHTRQKILSASKDYGTVVLKYSGKKFWQLTNIKDDSEQEAAFSTSPGDPTDIAYYHIFAQDINGNSTANIDFQVTIEFIVLLTEPVTLAESSL